MIVSKKIKGQMHHHDDLGSKCPDSGQFFTNFHKPYLRSAEEDRLAGDLIWKMTRIGAFWT